MIKKPKIRKYNKKLKKIEDEETMLKMGEELLYKHHDKLEQDKDKW